MARDAPDDVDEIEEGEEEFIGFLETLELETIKGWLKNPDTMAESIRKLEDPVDVIFYLDHLEATLELLSLIKDGELDYELELVSSETNRKQWQQLLQPHVSMNTNQQETLVKKLETIYDDFTVEAFNLSDMNPQDVISKHHDHLAYIVGLLSFFSLAISDMRGNIDPIEELFNVILNDEITSQIVRDFCQEELELGLY